MDSKPRISKARADSQSVMNAVTLPRITQRYISFRNIRDYT